MQKAEETMSKLLTKEYGKGLAVTLGVTLASALVTVGVAVLKDIADELEVKKAKGTTVRIINEESDDGS